MVKWYKKWWQSHVHKTKPMLHVYLIPTLWNVMWSVCTQSHLQNVLNARGQFSKFSQIADWDRAIEWEEEDRENQTFVILYLFEKVFFSVVLFFFPCRLMSRIFFIELLPNKNSNSLFYHIIFIAFIFLVMALCVCVWVYFFVWFGQLFKNLLAISVSAHSATTKWFRLNFFLFSLVGFWLYFSSVEKIYISLEWWKKAHQMPFKSHLCGLLTLCIFVLDCAILYPCVLICAQITLTRNNNTLITLMKMLMV